jgi:hypothetical protein
MDWIVAARGGRFHPSGHFHAVGAAPKLTASAHEGGSGVKRVRSIEWLSAVIVLAAVAALAVASAGTAKPKPRAFTFVDPATLAGRRAT